MPRGKSMSFDYSCRNGGKIEYVNKDFLEKEIDRIEEKIATSIGEEEVDVNVIIHALSRVYGGIMVELLKELKVEPFPERIRVALTTLTGFKAAMRDAILASSDSEELEMLVEESRGEPL
jgi:hypothetical protein